MVDSSLPKLFEYDRSGEATNSSRLYKEDETPRGLAVSEDGSLRWVVDAKGEVFLYDSHSRMVGNWKFEGIDHAEGITVSGDDVWIVDRASVSKIAYFAGGASRRNGSVSPTSTFKLASANRNPTDLVTNGSTIWVVNDGTTTDTVFVYSKDGASLGRWSMDTRNSSPSGITLDSSISNSILVVDSKTDAIFQYDSADSRRSGSQAASMLVALHSTNGNPQGIAVVPAVLGIPPLPSLAVPATPQDKPQVHNGGTWQDEIVNSLWSPFVAWDRDRKSERPALSIDTSLANDLRRSASGEDSYPKATSNHPNTFEEQVAATDIAFTEWLSDVSTPEGWWIKLPKNVRNR